VAFIELVVFGLTQHAVSWSDGGKIVFALAMIAPLSFFKGMPFPLGLRILSERHPLWIP